MSSQPRLTEPSGKAAELFRDLPAGKVQCTACARLCQLGEGQVGLCGVRGVVGGKLYLLVYGRVMAGHIDPIEKKPVVHFKPGSKIFSMATSGCNWLCRYCIAPGTPVLTDRGVMSIDQIYSSSGSSDEIVFPDSIRVLSHTGHWRFVDKAFRHRYRGKMLRVRPFYLPELRCTPNHGLLVADKKSGEPVKRRADQARAGDYLMVPRAKATLVSPNLDVAMVLTSVMDELMGDAHYARLDFDNRHVRFSRSKGTGLPRTLELNEDFGELLGLYAAEGSSIRASNRPNSWTLCLSFGTHEADLIGRAEELLVRIFGVHPRRVTQGPVTRVTVGSGELGALFAYTMGSDCYSKKVPDFVLLNTSTPIRSGFLRGYMRGDGFKTKNGKQSWIGTTSVSQGLTLGVWYLMFRQGLAPRFYVSNNPPAYEIEGRVVNRHNDYMTRVLTASDSENVGRATKIIETENGWLVPIRTIRSEDYEGDVYNLEVEEDHTYTACFVAVSNCQNYDISQRRKIEGVEAAPEDMVSKALAYGCEGMAYTYNQPTIFMEYARDVGRIARSKGLFNIFVSNGYDTPETVAMMDDFLDCVTVDFKGSGETKFVRSYIGIPNADPIFQSLLETKRRGKVHIEITDLVIPEVGDSLSSAENLCAWVYDNLGPDVPIHFLRFHPDYKMMDLPPTPVETLERHVAVGRKAGLNYVYIGNVPGHRDESTYCPGCGAVLIRRYSYEILEYNLDSRSRCISCGYKTPIVGPLSKSASGDRFVTVIS
ncbi:MAG: AmmeMemoRadiSam system radical SAM enzyme [Nitrososphaerota archaeon]|nr:AmmeMemoRadiSam system radical SAM enzyme [Nitrososphaerota archaeon]MDG7025210.1 AmmeMemoRadiSam system radical SAM enzyme [Nitrososphaerota archaeon]